MIAALRGTVWEREAGRVVLDVNGVGYLVHTTGRTAAALPDGEELSLHICTIVREDAFLLYGFAERAEREAFVLLREVNGVGPRHALAVLDTLTVDQLRQALVDEDLRTLVRVPGVGKKLASRLCLELKNKLAAEFDVPATVSSRAARRAEADPLPLALAQLDYKKREIDLALASEAVPKVGAAPLEVRLKAALTLLARNL